MRKGMLLSVYRNAEITTDCTLNGISNRYNRLILIDKEGKIPELFAPESPEQYVVLKNIHDSRHLAPCNESGEVLPGWYSFGGNFAHTSDSRFVELISKVYGRYINAAIKIHDRKEW